MSIFKEYAQYYDLLYRDKDYNSEVEYIHGLIQKYAPGAKSVLNLGCGSGRHDRGLADRDYSVTGVDSSEQMIETALASSQGNHNLEYVTADLRSLDISKQFDIVTSLFHVMSYQINNNDLISAFTTAFNHVKPGGLFIFDFWHGPGVLTDRPTVRLKELEDSSIHVTRIATPVMHSSENLVDVNYLVLIKDKNSGCTREMKETHIMRYLFIPELQFMLSSVGFTPVLFEEWLTSAQLSFTSWNGVVVARKSI